MKNTSSQQGSRQSGVPSSLPEKQNNMLVFNKKLPKAKNINFKDQQPEINSSKPLTPHHNKAMHRHLPLNEQYFKSKKDSNNTLNTQPQDQRAPAQKKALPSIATNNLHPNSSAQENQIHTDLQEQQESSSGKEQANTAGGDIPSSKAIQSIPPNSVASITSSQDREGLLQENIQLKQKNNDLVAENIRLKTRLMTTDRQNQKLQKLFQEDPEKRQPLKGGIIKGNNDQAIASLKNLIKDYKKEIEELREESTKIKKSVKYTRINELEVERKTYYEETVRLTKMLEDLNNTDQRIVATNQTIAGLMKEIQEYKTKLRDRGGVAAKVGKSQGLLTAIASPTDKNQSRVISGLKKSLKQKEAEVEALKKQMTEYQQTKKQSSSAVVACTVCQTLKTEKEKLHAQLGTLNSKVKEQAQEIQKLVAASKINLNPPPHKQAQAKKSKVRKPDPKLVSQCGLFLNYRLRAHHLLPQEIKNYLGNSQSEDCSLSQVIDKLLAQPFFILNKDYLQALALHLFYGQTTADVIEIDQSLKKPKTQILAELSKVIGPYSILEHKKEQEMFIQIAELVTNYCQHISTAFDKKCNGEGTISKQDLESFLNEIQLEKEYIDFIITQIILESVDLDHLNYFALFEIFYLPIQEHPSLSKSGKPSMLYGVSEPVKELDEEYEQSHSRTEEAILREELRENQAKQMQEEEPQLKLIE